jgi:sulfur carrier protein
MVQLTINGEVREVPQGHTLATLLQHLGLAEGPVAIERNREIVPRAQHAVVRVEAGDILEVVQFVGGG